MGMYELGEEAQRVFRPDAGERHILQGVMVRVAENLAIDTQQCLVIVCRD